MQTNIKEIRIKVKIIDDINYPDVKAQAFLSFLDEHERTMTFSGFTVRKSKFNEGYYVTPPSNKLFKFFRSEKSWWKEIEKEIIRDYEKATIPIIEE
jgi:hypothetical protein